MSVIQRNTRTIDLSAIENNMKAIRSSVPDSAKLIAVVKADGYGHGAVETALAAIKGGADMLAVAAVSEGVQLREKGIRVPVLVLGAVTASDVQEGAEYGLIQTVCSPEMVFLCEQAGEFLQKQTEVHLKIDTGMGRIGVRNEMERDAVLAALEDCPHVRLTGAFTHFSDADGDEDGIEFTECQYRQFLKLTEPLPESVLRHCCNSAAIHRFPEMALDIVRAGISLYGYPPVHTETALKPCMTWTAVISYIKDLPAGSYVSYGRTYRSDHPVRTATITCGYADGYFRACAKDGYVLIRGKRAKIIGRVCMDQMMADISDIDDARTGDEVVLLGKSGSESIDAEEIASWAGTISYEILCSSGSRVGRKYISHQ
ncbi:MAG: alanine racemase [Clostridia bacterium]|nr:alanine racemase [Clostridia bacterium]